MRLIGAVAILFGVVPAVDAQTDSSSRPLAAPALRRDADKVAREVGAILVDKCLACHGPEKKKGGLDLSRRTLALSGGDSGPAIVPGQAGESLLVEKVVEGEMPPNGPLSREQVAAVRAWVEAGATYPSEPLATPARVPPGGRSGRSGRSHHPGCMGPVRTEFARRSMRSSSPGSRPSGSGRRRRPIAPRSSAASRSTSPACPRRPSRSTRFWPTPTRWPMRSAWTGCWPRPLMANAGAGTGSTWSGSARARDMRPTCPGRRHGPIAIT